MDRIGFLTHTGHTVEDHEDVEAEFVRWPMDFDALSKGDVIDSEHLQRVTRCEAGTSAYQLKLLAVKNEIERRLAQRDYPVTCKIEKNAIRILSDLEASEYNEGQGELAVRKAYRSLRRLANVDPRNMTEQQQKEHSRRLIAMGATCAAIRETRRNLRIEHNKPAVRVALEVDNQRTAE